MSQIADIIEHKRRFKKIAFRTLFCTYKGQSLVSFFMKSIKMHRQILEQLDSMEFECVDDIDDYEEANPDMRRLVAILNQKTMLELSDPSAVPGGISDSTQ